MEHAANPLVGLGGPGGDVQELREEVDKAFLLLEAELDAIDLLPSNLTELAAYDTVVDPDGTEAFVLSLRDVWRIDRYSVDTPDGITVIAAKDGAGTNGNWLRFSIPHLSWGRQTSWFIDPVAGDDENDGGASGTAIKTWAEFNRRVRSDWIWSQSVTVEFLNDLPETDPVFGRFYIGTNAFFTLRGQRSTTFSGTSSSWTQNFATNDPGTLTVAGWTPVPGQVLEFTSGPATDGTAWVMNNLGSNNAYLTQPLATGTGVSGPTLKTPSAGGGDTLNTYTLTKVPIQHLEACGGPRYGGGGALIIEDIDFSWMEHYGVVGTWQAGSQMLVRDSMGAVETFGDVVVLTNVLTQYTGSAGYVNSAFGRSLTLSVYGGGALNKGLATGAATFFLYNYLCVGAGAALQFGSGLAKVVSYHSIGFYGCTRGLYGTAAAELTMNSGTTLHGSGNSYGLDIVSTNVKNTTIVLATISMVTTVADVRTPGINYTWSQLPLYDPVTKNIITTQSAKFPLPGQTVVAAVANLGTIDTTNFESGVEVLSQDVREVFRLDISSAAAADGINVVNAKKGAGTNGRWIRCGSAPNGVGVVGNLTAGATRYALANLTESVGPMPLLATRAGNLRGLRCYLGTAPGAGESVQVTLYINGVVTTAPIRATISDASTTAQDMTNLQAVAAGDRVDVQIVNSNNGSFAAANLVVSYELT
jgi:hypothetical protein